MSQRTRDEHIQWCKERAHRAYQFEKERGNPEGGRTAAISSMLSDLEKHPETAKLPESTIFLAFTVRDEPSLFAFINGYN